MNRHYTPVLPPGGSARAVLRGGAQQDLSQLAPELIRQTKLHKEDAQSRKRPAQSFESRGNEDQSFCIYVVLSCAYV
jgi:hypothetical protein